MIKTLVTIGVIILAVCLYQDPSGTMYNVGHWLGSVAKAGYNGVIGAF